MDKIKRENEFVNRIKRELWRPLPKEERGQSLGKNFKYKCVQVNA